MSNACEGCGVCCKAFITKNRNNWAKKHLIKLSKKQVLSLNIIQEEMISVVFDNNSFYQTCDLYDEVTGKCTDYDNRPYMCTSFPHNEGAPHGYKVACKLSVEKFSKEHK